MISHSNFSLRNIFSVWALIIIPFLGVYSQAFSGISMVYNHDFSEWVILDESQEVVGEIKTRWFRDREMYEWEYRLYDLTGTIRQKYRNDTTWELDGPNALITFKPVFGDDYSSWRITNNDLTIVFESKWGNRMDEWLTRDDRNGVYYTYTIWELDPRDWTITDDLSDHIPVEFKLAMSFVAMYANIPRQD